MKMIKVWILPEEYDACDESFLQKLPFTYIFPFERYKVAINTTLNHENITRYIESDWWKESFHPNAIKACQNLALKLELEKEVEHGD